MKTGKTFLRSYAFSLVLLGCICIGAAVGWLMGPKAAVLRPLGTLFLNALFVAVIPLVFFSISSAVAGMASTRRLFKILGWMLLIFAATGITSSSLMVAGVHFFPPGQHIAVTKPAETPGAQQTPAESLVNMIMAPNFVDILSTRNVFLPRSWDLTTAKALISRLSLIPYRASSKTATRSGRSRHRRRRKDAEKSRAFPGGAMCIIMPGRPRAWRGRRPRDAR